VDDVGLLAAQQPHQANERARIAWAGLTAHQVDWSAGRGDLLGDWPASVQGHHASVDAHCMQVCRHAKDQLLGATYAKVLTDQERLHAGALTMAP